MFTKSIIITIAALLAGTIALPAEGQALQSRATSTIGQIYAFSGAGYTGNQTLIEVAKGAYTFCEEWADYSTDNPKPLYAVKSYNATNVACFLFTETACGGEVNGDFASGNQPNADLPTFESFYCVYESN